MAQREAWLGRSIAARFDEVAAANRSRVAIRTPHGEIRYGALATLSDRIAAALGKRLAQRRLRAPAPIALLLPQGITAIAAQLGILKAGACYLPLDSRHPPANLAQTIEHAGAPLVITNAKLAGLAQHATGDARALFDVDDVSRWESRAIPEAAAVDALAYLYYTSGSTGRPKGVADTHRNVLHNIYRYTRSLGIGGGDRLSLVQSPAFSGVVSSTYAALLNGAMLCPYDLYEDGPNHLADWLAESGVTIYHSVPTLFRKLVAGRRPFPAMRIVRLEGDRALWSDAALFKSHFPPAAVLVNGLGTTETGIVRQFFVSGDTAAGEGLLPVGYALPDVETFIVDDTGDRLPANAIGEIVVQGSYLAAGYWRDPDRTADKFRPGAHGSDRRYRTGDLGRMGDDGCLEHLGRRDDIVKIRGQSVDPTLVEAALASIPGVADAAAAAREREGGENELIAFITASGATQPAPAAVATALRQRLPDAMVPTAIIVLDALPVTPFAKIDRAAIAALAANLAPAHGGAPRPPATALEEEIARIWGRVLARASVPGNVAFLDIGGDSMQAMEILVRIRERLGVDMSVPDFFTLPTVESQARFLEARGAAGGAAVELR